MKLVRALGITMELLSKHRVTATELAARFEVSIRTIYRDIELINEAGIPVASYTGADGGFEVMDGYYLTKQHFSLQDLSMIYSLLKGMEGIMSPQPAAIMGKLTILQPELVQAGAEKKLILDLAATDAERSLIQPILQAIQDKKVVSFSYTDSEGNATSRNVEPDNLYWGSRSWYLNGYCLMRQADRMFRLSRMSNLEPTKSEFQPRRPSPSEPMKTIPEMEVHLRFDPSVRQRVLEHFHEECEQTEDGLDVRTVIYDLEYAVLLVLSYGLNVTVLAPDELKHSVMKMAREIQLRYS
ncbi:YafY family protein [Paenibacillus sp. JCM 10914]|uniref:helix-turn-helix transcriptional regulator n=1 Tax=Paenibacillus sp. JCM 10914 TaxID=1236974 RepID=UPI0003CC6FC5|nr:YafY family protein [Paenibacillus sp. JCM 10914]GAE09785.1 transcriptional regulator, DeoR family [Paenibacillus sp. JCM 10914]